METKLLSLKSILHEKERNPQIVNIHGFQSERSYNNYEMRSPKMNVAHSSRQQYQPEEKKSEKKREQLKDVYLGRQQKGTTKERQRGASSLSGLNKEKSSEETTSSNIKKYQTQQKDQPKELPNQQRIQELSPDMQIRKVYSRYLLKPIKSFHYLPHSSACSSSSAATMSSNVVQPVQTAPVLSPYDTILGNYQQYDQLKEGSQQYKQQNLQHEFDLKERENKYDIGISLALYKSLMSMEVSQNDKNVSLINQSASSVRMQLAKLKNINKPENYLNKGDINNNILHNNNNILHNNNNNNNNNILDRRSVSSGGIFNSKGAITARERLAMNKTSQNYRLDRNREYKEDKQEKESVALSRKITEEDKGEDSNKKSNITQNHHNNNSSYGSNSHDHNNRTLNNINAAYSDHKIYELSMKAMIGVYNKHYVNKKDHKVSSNAVSRLFKVKNESDSIEDSSNRKTSRKEGRDGQDSANRGIRSKYVLGKNSRFDQEIRETQSRNNEGKQLLNSDKKRQQEDNRQSNINHLRDVVLSKGDFDAFLEQRKKQISAISSQQNQQQQQQPSSENRPLNEQNDENIEN